MVAAQGGARVVVVGSSNTDLLVRVRELPRPGETVLGSDLLRAQGGKGANQAVAAARAGATVAFIGCVGADAFGDEAVVALRAEGINIVHVRRVADTPTGVALITVATRGQNSIVVARGANARLAAEDIERAGAVLRGARMVVAQLEVPLSAVTRALSLAREGGARTLLNPAPAQPLDDDLLALVDLLVCNESEAEVLTGGAVADGAGAEAAARALVGRGARSVIVTRGAAGFLVLDAAGAYHGAALEVSAVDTTGAGDAFIGALACRLAAGDPVGVAARFAAAAAALSVQRAGAQPSLPTAAAIEAFLRERA
jgi:ribokinase